MTQEAKFIMKKILLLIFGVGAILWNVYSLSSSLVRSSNQTVERELKDDIIIIPYDDGFTMLMRALETKQPLSVIQKLVEEGIDINAVQADFLRIHKPTLRFALERGDDPESIEILRFLIAKGANVNVDTYNRVNDETLYGFMSLLHYAVITCSSEVIQLLLDAGADADVNYIPQTGSIKNPRTPLQTAKILGRQDIVELLIRAGAKS